MVSARIQHWLSEGGDRFRPAPRTLLSAANRAPSTFLAGTLPQVHLRYISALTCWYSARRRGPQLRQLGREAPPGPATCGPGCRIRPAPRTGRRRADTGHHGADSAQLDPWFLGAWFATEPAREQIRRLARGTAIQRVAIHDLASLTVRLPPLSTQQEIGRRFRAFENAVQAHRAVAASLQELRDLDLVVTFAGASTDHNDGGHGSAGRIP